MHSDGKPRRGMAPVLPTQASLCQLRSVRSTAGAGHTNAALRYAPSARGQVDLLEQRQLADKGLGPGIRVGPAAGAVHPWRRIARRRRGSLGHALLFTPSAHALCRRATEADGRTKYMNGEREEARCEAQELQLHACGGSRVARETGRSGAKERERRRHTERERERIGRRTVAAPTTWIANTATSAPEPRDSHSMAQRRRRQMRSASETVEGKNKQIGTVTGQPERRAARGRSGI